MDRVSSRNMADDERDWRFDPEDVGERESEETGVDEIEQLRSTDPEPGSPSFENSVFVILGVALTIAVLLLLLSPV
jgi:hypothetical protein